MTEQTVEERIKSEDDAYRTQYATEGCAAKGQPHLFDGDPSSVYTLLYCINCRIPKKRGIALPGDRIDIQTLKREAIHAD